MPRHHRRCSALLDCVSCCRAKSPLSSARDLGTFVGTGAASLSRVDDVGARGEEWLAHSPAGELGGPDPRPSAWQASRAPCHFACYSCKSINFRKRSVVG